MDNEVKDLYILLLKYEARVIGFSKCIGETYKVVVQRPTHLVDIDSSSKYVQAYIDHIYLRNRKNEQGGKILIQNGP